MRIAVLAPAKHGESESLYNTMTQILSELFYVIDMVSREYRVNYSVLFSCGVVLIMTAIMTGDVRGQLLSKEHRTQAAAERTKELWCYHCNSMDGMKCSNISENNNTDQHIKCKDEKTCMVKRITLITSTGNSSNTTLWRLERNCSRNCEPGCIMIGERSKLHACITCCEGNFCNSGSGTQAVITNQCVQQFYTSIIATLTLMFIVY